MRFFFHRYNDVITMDDEGIELADRGAALRRARDEALTMAAESVRTGHLNLSHFIEVMDEGQSVIDRVSFSEVIAITR